MDFNDFTLQRNMIWWFPWSFSIPVLALIFDAFWHRFRLHFGSLLQLFSCFFDIVFCIDFWINFLVETWSKMYSNQYRECILFGITFRHTCTFYPRNTYKCQKTVFPTFFKQLKEFIDTCTFYPRNTYKCAMTVFTILTKKKWKKLDYFLDLWLPFGSLLAPFWLPLAPFWLPSNVKLLQKSCFCSIWFHLLLMFETIFVKK